MKLEQIILIVILMVAAILRLNQLGQIPVSISDDEVRLIYNAYSIWTTGRDVNGNFLPPIFLNNGFAFNPLPIYLTSPVVGILGTSLFSSRLLFALSGVGGILLVYLICLKLLGNRLIAILTAATLVFNAWHLQITRLAYEGPLALFFFLLGTYLFLITKKHKLKMLFLSLVMFICGFYSYSGFKATFPIIMAILTWYKRRELNLKQKFFIVAMVAATFLSFAFLAKTSGAASYGNSQFIWQDREKTALAVELERRASAAPQILKKLYHNKLTYWSKIFIERYQYAFSPQYLFVNQEGSGIFSLWGRGQFYYHEAFLILLGALYIFIKHRRQFWFSLALLLVSPLPSAVGPEPVNYSIRASFMLPWLGLLTGAGIYSLNYFLIAKSLRYTAFALLTFLYLYYIGGYLTQYYFEWPKHGAKYFAKAAQDAVGVINKEKDKSDQIIIDGFGSTGLLHFAFYTNLEPQEVQQIYSNSPLAWNNITFNSRCTQRTQDMRDGKTTYIISFDCVRESGSLFYNRANEADYVVKSPDSEDEWFVFSALSP